MSVNSNRLSLDTNILVYAFDEEAGKRHTTAVRIMQHVAALDCVLSLQSLSEFFNAITRKKACSIQLATEYVHKLEELFPVVTAKQSSLSLAIKVVSQNKIAFWDAMLWATAKDAGVTLLLSEDFQHGQLLEGVRIVNPFIPNEFWHV